MAEPTKQETEQAFKVLKAQKGNKVSGPIRTYHAHRRIYQNSRSRHALIAKLVTRHGLALHSVYTYASNVPAFTVIWACISVLYGEPGVFI
jgi:hypothetical protein